ncbi:MAG: hypothetical protein LBM04_00185 [Opitutaceae bacterium]|jgi:hypothetical protein|nr:hypothetical protein [Opitutaceae bacterium]
MKRLVLICLLPAAALLSVTGCSSKPKPTPFIATEVEENFKQRWIAKRMADLQATKQAADANEARRVATGEFRQKFASTSVVQQQADADAAAATTNGNATP